jgi:hypothetical protein
MNNSPAHSRYSELSLSQQSYHVSPEPTIHHQQQEDTSDDEDEKRESSMGDTQHDDDANVSDFVGGLVALPPKAILPPKPKEPSQRLLKGKVAVPKAGKTTRVQWTGKLDEANTRITNLENYIHQSSQTTQTLYTTASTSIDHQYTQLKSNFRDLVTATAVSAKQKQAASQHNLAKKSIASQKANLKSLRAKLNTTNLKLAEWKLKEAAWNAERKSLRKQAQAEGSTGTSNKREDMLFRAKLEVEKTAAKMDLKKESKKEEKGKQLKKKTKRFDKMRGMFQRGQFVSCLSNSFCSVHFMGHALILTDIGLAL